MKEGVVTISGQQTGPCHLSTTQHQLTDFTNSRMHLFHIPQCPIQNRNVHISVLNGALRDMEQVHSGICTLGQLTGTRGNASPRRLSLDISMLSLWLWYARTHTRTHFEAHVVIRFHHRALESYGESIRISGTGPPVAWKPDGLPGKSRKRSTGGANRTAGSAWVEPTSPLSLPLDDSGISKLKASDSFDCAWCIFVLGELALPVLYPGTNEVLFLLKLWMTSSGRSDPLLWAYSCKFKFNLTYWDRDKMAVILQTTVACLLPSHYLNQLWTVLNWTFGNKFQWKFIQYTTILILQIEFENVVWKNGGDLVSVSMCVNRLYCNTLLREYWG